METFVQALIISFREGLEAFIIIAILLKFLSKTNNVILKKSVWHGAFTGVLASLILGIILMAVSSLIGGINTTAKLWESIASFIAVILITTFIIWMIKYGSKIEDHVKSKAKLNLSRKGIFLLAMFMVAREGAEIAIFAFAGKYSVLPIVIGITLSIGLVALMHYSIVSISLKTIFGITLAYLIIQAGFLLGYSIHEGLSALKSLELITADNPVFIKVFNLSGTSLNHKEGIIGVPLYVFLGWYSKPEWIQFIVQYSFSITLFGYWYTKSKSKWAVRQGL
ncbi:MAG: FTR1 family protein [Candidatus Peribacteraceae bacterium]|jgi:high-affinity iron transporter|nr:FTR1 family protein [Candidatus Peribacteraceae bacterium]MDP7645899.1 FTR1 family protein [Candidatus Peribacteraceae bacterium]|tara:strand:+ start:1364 stop:2203 length:840 start_codon:yes stop_codon:yes gene_type:complete